MDAHPEDGEAPQMNGSMLVVSAESLEKARELIAKDIYTTHGVWDIENVSSRCPLSSLVKLKWESNVCHFVGANYARKTPP